MPLKHAGEGLPLWEALEPKHTVDLSALKVAIGASPKVAVDTETDADLRLKSPSWVTDNVFMVTVAWGPTFEQSEWIEADDPACAELLRWILFEYRGRIVFHNTKFDLHHIRKTFSIITDRLPDDSYVQAFLVNDSLPKALKPRSAYEFHDESLRDDERELKEFIRIHNLHSYKDVPRSLSSRYARQDTVLTWRLDEHFYPTIQSKYASLYENELKLTRLLIKMEYAGVRVDREYLMRRQAEMELRRKELAQAIDKIVGRTFEVGSDDKLSQYLYEELKLPVLGRTKNNNPSTDAKTLRALYKKTELPILPLLWEHSSTSSSLDDFVAPLIRFSVTDGRIHCNLNQCGARGGRFSSDDPNLQNQPKPDEEKKPGSEVARTSFICDEDAGSPRTMDFWDYDQIELRGFAHYTNDPGLIESFKRGDDPYAEMASWMFGGVRADYPKESDKRGIGKVGALALIYGAGPGKLGTIAGTDKQGGMDLLDTFFKKSPGTKFFLKESVRRAEERGYVFNAFGRTSYLDRDHAYVAANRILQGWAADLIKSAMVRIDDAGVDTTREQGLRLNVHDDVRYDGLDDEQKGTVQEILTDYKCRVPILVTHKSSTTNWAAAH